MSYVRVSADRTIGSTAASQPNPLKKAPARESRSKRQIHRLFIEGYCMRQPRLILARVAHAVPNQLQAAVLNQSNTRRVVLLTHVRLQWRGFSRLHAILEFTGRRFERFGDA